MDPAPQAAFRQHSPFSDPGSRGAFLATAGSTPADWTRSLQSCLVHAAEGERYGLKIRRESFREELLRKVSDVLDRLAGLDSRPLSEPRSPEARLVTLCRTASLLFVAAARQAGRAARARSGYASYFGGPYKWADHWIAELWDDAALRWRRVDPLLDPVLVAAYRVDFDPFDVPDGAFLDAADAWLDCRAGKRDEDQFGFSDHWKGLDSLKSALLRDFDSLNRAELLPWDAFGELMAAKGSALSETDLAELDAVASALEAGDQEALEGLWREGRHGRQTRAALSLLDAAASGRPLASPRPSDAEELGVAAAAADAPRDGSGTAGQGDAVAGSAAGGAGGAEEASGSRSIRVRGARAHNLKGIDVDFPRGKLTVVTGRSGSGKSSLVFDVLYAACRREYWDCFGADGRSPRPPRAEADSVDGARPAAAVDQRPPAASSRSSVATMTGAAEDLRRLFADLSRYGCPSCGRGMDPAPPRKAAEAAAALLERGGLEIRAGAADGPVITAGSLEEAAAEAYRRGNGFLALVPASGPARLLARGHACPYCGLAFRPRSPALYDAARWEGACPDCLGAGSSLQVDPDLVVTRPDLSLLDGASPWWGRLRDGGKNANWIKGEILALAKARGVDLELPWRDLDAGFRREALHGTGAEKVRWEYRMAARGREGVIERPVEGAVGGILRLFRSTASEKGRAYLRSFMSEKPCPACGGEKACPEARSSYLAGLRYPEALAARADALRSWAAGLARTSGEAAALEKKLAALVDVGLGYLEQSRSSAALSGGEAQRVKLASKMGGRHPGVYYVLDEPTRGLHPAERGPLLAAVALTARLGEGAAVIEHAPEALAAADLVVEVGPGSGAEGGRIAAAGRPDEIRARGGCLTAQLLSGALAVPPAEGAGKARPEVTLLGARLHNLKGDSASFPLGAFTAVSGPSGSGKSSLVSGTLEPALQALVHRRQAAAGPFDAVEGWEAVGAVVGSDQDAAARSARSTVATYVGLSDGLRDLYAASPQARSGGLAKDAFSFNTAEGRCPACKGLGRLPPPGLEALDILVDCDECGGSRFARNSAAVRVDGRTLPESLALTAAAAAEAFRSAPAVAGKAAALVRVGLGYLALDRGMDTLSGGEARRAKLASALASRRKGTLFVLDEPGAGLHAVDLLDLLAFIRSLTAEGHTVVAVTHDLPLIAGADRLVELGPEGGPGGGRVVAQGTPAAAAARAATPTGRCLASYWAGGSR